MQTTSPAPKTVWIRNNHCVAQFTSVEPCCGSVRVLGWVSAPDRSEGFRFCDLVAEAINKADFRSLRSIGGYCNDSIGKVYFPFEFEVDPHFNLKYCRTETLDETVRGTWKALRKVARADITPTGIA